mgnify:CR=1 FL=1
MREQRPFEDLQAEGLLWLINRSALHPLGCALAFHTDDEGNVTGWSMLGDGTQVFGYSEEVDDEKFNAMRLFFELLEDE